MRGSSHLQRAYQLQGNPFGRWRWKRADGKLISHSYETFHAIFSCMFSQLNFVPLYHFELIIRWERIDSRFDWDRGMWWMTSNCHFESFQYRRLRARIAARRVSNIYKTTDCAQYLAFIYLLWKWHIPFLSNRPSPWTSQPKPTTPL